ncbi:MAG: LptE family protein [Chitinophagaceae bacterium]
MILKNKVFRLLLTLSLTLSLCACGIYSFTGASVEGKTINIHFIENKAPNAVPTLSASFTNKLRNRILSQTSLAQLNNDNTDYSIQGDITQYDVSVASINADAAAKNRLTISVNIQFENKLNPKANFTQGFTRFADFPSSQNIQSVETQLITTISEQLADDIFNKAFVNW